MSPTRSAPPPAEPPPPAAVGNGNGNGDEDAAAERPSEAAKGKQDDTRVSAPRDSCGSDSERVSTARKSRVLRRMLGARKAKALKIEAFQQAAAVARLVEWSEKYRWRSEREFGARTALAW
eukprot:5870503-Prymnesium_polylepis.1